MPTDIGAKVASWRTQLLDTTKRNRLISFKVGRTGGIALAHPDPDDLWQRLVTDGKPLTFAWKRDLINLPPGSDEGAGGSALALFDPDEGAGPVTSGCDLGAGEVQALFDPGERAGRVTGEDVLELCRRSARLRADHILTDLTDRHLAARLARLALNARESLSEQGVATLYVAVGILRWFESAESQVEVHSPLLLVPVRLDRDSVEAPWRLHAGDDDILPNHSLAQRLAGDFRLRLPLPDEEDDPAALTWRKNYFGEVERCVRHLPRWEVLDEAALGTFSFQKLAMWEDLDRNLDRIKEHDLCRAIAGDPAAVVPYPSDLPRAEELDRKAHPAQTFHILDADSSQQEAVEAAKRGASLVLDGPPGTGKSQTIANIIAESLAAGKTALFVSEKAAALEVVQRRLQAQGLGDFCLGLHSHKANKREVVAELGRCLALGPEHAPDVRDDLDRLHEARRQLNDYVRELHTPRPPLNLTIYQAHGELARLARLTSVSRCPVPEVLAKDAGYLRSVVELLERLPDCRSVIDERDRHPWRGCRAAVYSLTLRDDVHHHFDRLAGCLARAGEATSTLHRLGFGAAAPNRAQWLGSLAAAQAILACPLLPADWFRGDPRPVAEAAVQLDNLTQAYRRTWAAMPEFAPHALRSAEATTLAASAPPAGETGLIPRPGDTLRALPGRLAGAANALRELHRGVTAVAQAVQRVGALLRLSFDSWPVSVLPLLAEFADQVARMRPVPKSWWNPARRRELEGVMTRCLTEAQAAQEARAELAARLSPRAFTPEGASLAARASRVRWLLARLLPGWRALKAEASGWYVAGAPKTAALLDDLAKLGSYHRRADYCRQIREQYAADVVVGAGGEPDWAGTLEALKSVDRLEQITQIPAPLQAALSTGQGLDRPALAQAAKALAEALASLRRHGEALARGWDLADVTDAATRHIRPTPQGLAAWADVQASAANGRAAFLGRLQALLAEGRDVPAGALPARIAALAELFKLRSEVAGLCARVLPGRSPQAPEDCDWAKWRRAAEALLRLLDRWRGALPAAAVKALTDREVRTQLEEAVGRSERAYAEGFEESWHFLEGLFETDRPVSTGIMLDAAPLGDLQRWLADRAEDAQRLREWIRFGEVEREVARAGVAAILAEVLAGQVKPEEAGDAFRSRFLRLWVDAHYARAPALHQFSSDGHERLIERFRALDRRGVATTAARIRAFQLCRTDRPRPVAGDAPETSELGALLREVNKKRRHLPLRKLFAGLPTLLPRLKPCLMMSPLAVSTYLQAPDCLFDLVIFDEASQVRPHDAICAIYRGRQLIVAGDQKQLPPTSFFDRVGDEAPADENAGDGGLQDYESILDVCCTLGLPRRRLRWHYRSRREGLIAFANHFVYDNELVTFPSVHDMAGNPAVAFAYITEGRWKAGASGGFNAVEARRTAEMVLAHFRDNPRQSLGVIAFSQRQQLRIGDEVERLRRDHPDLEEFFHEDRDEAFFVKNLENVQGDERDVIFLSVAYGPDEAGGVVRHNFGPLNRPGGERRLNVAVTRAKERMVVISSMRAHDIDLSRTGAHGVKLLRDFLDYAERGPEALRAAITGAGERCFDSPFEREVYEELTRRGLKVHPQVGCSKFHIDLAIVDPRAPGRYLLGVECDGASYHSSATARDRDRLRQQVLEGLGWRICRIWSTDWLRDRRGQVGRVLAALEKAQQQPAEPSTPAPPSAARPVIAPTSAPGPGAAAVGGPNYASIDDVPEPVLRDIVCRLLHTFGATAAGEVAQSAARDLGFKRTGRRIQDRVENCVEGLIRAGSVCRTADQRLQLTQTTRAASG
jgi:very-short-patch-repair endonuclease